jgi:TolB-like protein/DNA-binding winged helix-turn-helix (wHTH) protein
VGTYLETPRAVRFGLFEADLRSGELHKNGKRVRIQEQPFKVLAALLDRPGETVTHAELKQRLWPDDTFVDFDHSLATAILKIRSALEDSASRPQYIETVPRHGYRFIAPVELAASDEEPGISPLASAARVIVQRHWGALVAAGVFLVVLAAGFALNLGGLRQRLLGEPNAGVLDSVAVLPFRNANGNAEADYLSDGLTAELINQLAQVPGLRVMAYGTVLRYQTSNLSPRQAGLEMKVAAVVTGRVRRDGDRLLVGVELLDVARGTEVWGERFDRKMADSFTLQKEIARRISSRLRATLTKHDERLHASHPSHPSVTP